MKEIILTNRDIAKVDDIDYSRLIEFTWYPNKTGQTTYAETSIKINGVWRTVKMHRMIMNTPDNEECDHADHNGLNCQRYNLRNCSHSQNQMNRIPRGKSIYKGVGFVGGCIRARIRNEGKLIHIGCYKTEIEAAEAYNVKAKELFGEFAYLNRLPESIVKTLEL